MKRQTKSLGSGLVGVVLAGAVLLTAGLWGGTLLAETATTAPALTPPTAENKAQAVKRYHAAKELFDQAKYQESQAENEQALKLDPSLPDAKLLHLRLEARLNGTVPTTAATTKSAKTELLNAEQIYRIRVAELGDSPEEIRAADIRGSIPRITLEEFWVSVVVKEARGTELSQNVRDAFMTPNNFPQQVWRIKKSGETKYYGQIKLDTDPPVIKEFKQKLQPFVLQNCATSGCHGGNTVTVNGFHLYGAMGKVSDVQTYTNFYIMTNYSKGEAFMLDRQQPARSLCIQYGLAKEANFVHPSSEKFAIKNRISGPEDQRFKDMFAVVRSLKLLQPSYGFTFPLPKKTVTTER